MLYTTSKIFGLLYALCKITTHHIWIRTKVITQMSIKFWDFQVKEKQVFHPWNKNLYFIDWLHITIVVAIKNINEHPKIKKKVSFLTVSLAQTKMYNLFKYTVCKLIFRTPKLNYSYPNNVHSYILYRFWWGPCCTSLLFSCFFVCVFLYIFT
jgi:hypothetical protein